VSISRTLRRLHELRAIQEQEKKSALALALQHLHQLEQSLRRAQERAADGRTLLNSSLQSGQVEDRIAGSEEIASAERMARILRARMIAARNQIAGIRNMFLAARLQRRQVETLLESAIARDSEEGKRRTQIALDEWHLSRRTSSGGKYTAEMRGSDKPADAAEQGST
jgi:hypothetical protein